MVTKYSDIQVVLEEFGGIFRYLNYVIFAKNLFDPQFLSFFNMQCGDYQFLILPTGILLLHVSSRRRLRRGRCRRCGISQRVGPMVIDTEENTSYLVLDSDAEYLGKICHGIVI